MFGIAIMFIAYLIASSGAFGGDLIYALDVLENWYWIIFTIIAVIAFIIFLAFMGLGAAAGHDFNRTGIGASLGAFGGSTIGGFFAVLMLIKISLQLWLTIWLMNSIDPMALDFDSLTNKQMMGLGFLLLMSFLPGISFSNSKD